MKDFKLTENTLMRSLKGNVQFTGSQTFCCTHGDKTLTYCLNLDFVALEWKIISFVQKKRKNLSWYLVEQTCKACAANSDTSLSSALT